MRYIVAVLVAFALVSCHKSPPEYESRYTPPPVIADPGVPVAMVGDSYTSGTPVGGSGSRSWPRQSEVRLRDQGIDIYPRIAAEGGAGYVNRSSRSGLRFIDEVSNLSGPAYQLFIIVGSVNDAGAPPDDLEAAVQATLIRVKEIAPQARILVVGPPWLVASSVPGILRARDIVKTQSEAAGATFIDPIAEDWLSADEIGRDGTHPTDRGHEILTDKLTPLIAQQLESP